MKEERTISPSDFYREYQEPKAESYGIRIDGEYFRGYASLNDFFEGRPWQHDTPLALSAKDIDEYLDYSINTLGCDVDGVVIVALEGRPSHRIVHRNPEQWRRYTHDTHFRDRPIGLTYERINYQPGLDYPCPNTPDLFES